MPEGHPFIAASAEYARFDALSRRFPRSARRFQAAEWQSQGALVRPLADFVGAQLSNLKDSAVGWSAIVVSVEEGDGMTWAASAVARQTAHAAPKFAQLHIAPQRSHDGLLDLAGVIPRSRVLALAQDAG